MRGFQECAICKLTFKEKEMEVSHDIPKYLGGTDSYGRHWLCKKCHDKYEIVILSRCYIEGYEKLLSSDVLDRKKRIKYITKIKNEQEISLKSLFLIIACRTKEEFFND
jgi:hypothetical protein